MTSSPESSSKPFGCRCSAGHQNRHACLFGLGGQAFGELMITSSLAEALIAKTVLELPKPERLSFGVIRIRNFDGLRRRCRRLADQRRESPRP